MIDISIGAVGAAFVAGIVSIFGLIIGKEQKISEFRQAWIDELRKCLVAYLVNINAIADAIRLQKSNNVSDKSTIFASYKTLNEASHGITLRINSKEGPARALLKSMQEFESLASANETLTVEKIRATEKEFMEAAKMLLKFEWKRVKRGERIFVWAKRIALLSTAVMFVLLIYAFTVGKKSSEIYHEKIERAQNI